MALTEQDMKERERFTQELLALIAKKRILDDEIEQKGFSSELMRRVTELNAELQSLATRQDQFARKHFLLG
jgi:hypothetical protein